MRHATFIIAAAVVVGAACSDRVSLPSSPLSPRDASFDVGDPPPPPVSGEGRAELDVVGGGCEAHGSFDITYTYFLNKPGKNAWLKMDMHGHGHDVQVHQNKKIDAHGSIAGSGFTFDIDDALSGNLLSEPRVATIQLKGKLTTEGGTCPANATLVVTLGSRTS